MTYDSAEGGVGHVPSWPGARIVYSRGWMILAHLRKNGYGAGRHAVFKEMKRVEAEMAALVLALETGEESPVRDAVTRNLRFLTTQQLAATSR
jgi:hypothetical protein